MAKAAKHIDSKIIPLTALFIVVLALHVLFIRFSIQSTTIPKVKSENLRNQIIQEQKNAAGYDGGSTPNEIEDDQQTEENITSSEPQEVKRGKIEQNPIPALLNSNPAFGIYSNTPSLGVYSDSQCTENTASMNVGIISAGGSVNESFYIKNKGNNDLTLSLYTTNWNPPTADGPLALTWNLEGTVLSVDQVLTATLTLRVSPNIQGITTFSFDVVIQGIE